VSKVEEAMMGVTLLVIEGQSSIDMFNGIGQGTPSPTHRPRGVVRLEQHLRAIQFARDCEEIVRNLFRSVQRFLQPKRHTVLLLLLRASSQSTSEAVLN
jgi:hypothetical protein